MINFSPPQAPKKSADFAENQPILEVLRMALFIRMAPPFRGGSEQRGGAILIIQRKKYEIFSEKRKK